MKNYAALISIVGHLKLLFDRRLYITPKPPGFVTMPLQSVDPLLLGRLAGDLGVAVYSYVESCQLVDSLATNINSMSQTSVDFIKGSYQVVILGNPDNIDTYSLESLHLKRQGFQDAMQAMQQQKIVVDHLANQCINVGQQIANQGGGNSPEVIGHNVSISKFNAFFKIAFEQTKYNWPAQPNILN